MTTDKIGIITKSIIEFMGYVPVTEEYFLNEALNGDHNFDLFYIWDTAKFHKDWRLLMLVIAKIEALGYYVNITGTYCSIGNIDTNEGNLFIEKDSSSKIESTFEAIFCFTNWYNHGN